MAKKGLIKVEFNEASMRKKLKKLSKVYGEGQRQGVKRWGVQTCRELAKYTQVFGKVSVKGKDVTARKAQIGAMRRDALKVFIVHKNGAYKKQRGGKYGVVNIDGKWFSVGSERYKSSAEEVDRIIQQHRVTKPWRSGNSLVFTKWLRGKDKYVCSEATMNKAISQRHKRLAGMAKDGWIDAAKDIGKGQKGKGKIEIGASFLKGVRKARVSGYAIEDKTMFKSNSYIVNNLPYVSTSYVLRNKHKKAALKDGMKNTIKWYEKTIRAENKKKK